MFARMMANQGFGKIMGLKRFGAAARGIGRGAMGTYRGAVGAGKMYQAGMRGPAIGYGMGAGVGQMGQGFRRMGRWATGAGRGGAGRGGVMAARAGMLGAGAFGAGAAADFMNPWGLGWGD